MIFTAIFLMHYQTQLCAVHLVSISVVTEFPSCNTDKILNLLHVHATAKGAHVQQRHKVQSNQYVVEKHLDLANLRSDAHSVNERTNLTNLRGNVVGNDNST